MAPDGQRPSPYKVYYDVATYFVTQTVFCFTTAPFVILTMRGSLLAWTRVYYYAIAGVAASMALFASPAKDWLIQQQRKRSHPSLHRTHSYDTSYQPLLGLPHDPQRDVDEAVQEIRAEVQARRRHGASAVMPKGQDLKDAAEERLGKQI
jgi:lysophospholipid acyltransferase